MDAHGVSYACIYLCGVFEDKTDHYAHTGHMENDFDCDAECSPLKMMDMYYDRLDVDESNRLFWNCFSPYKCNIGEEEITGQMYDNCDDYCSPIFKTVISSMTES